MYAIDKITDFVIHRLTVEEQPKLVNLKLQKLLYYIQAWYLAFEGQPLFDGKFQAWVHGPVNRQIYDRFKDSKYLYSDITSKDMSTSIEQIDLPEKVIMHIENVLEVYAGFSGIELEIMTHQEKPWIEARKGVSPTARCENEISEETMRIYYKSRIVD